MCNELDPFWSYFYIKKKIKGFCYFFLIYHEAEESGKDLQGNVEELSTGCIFMIILQFVLIVHSQIASEALVMLA